MNAHEQNQAKNVESKQINTTEKKLEQTNEKVKKSRKKHVIIIFVLIVIASLVASYFFYFNPKIIKPMITYKKACTLLENKEYNDALLIFSDIKDYNDSNDKIIECKYYTACALLDSAVYDDAISMFSEIKNFKDSKDKIIECKYYNASALLNSAEYDNAISIFSEIEDYKDCSTKIVECKYNKALSLKKNKAYEEAIELFTEINNYKDSKNKVNECKYEYVSNHKNNEDKKTYKYLTELTNSNYKDSLLIFTELYLWRVNMEYCNTTKDDNITKISHNNFTDTADSISKYCNYFHLGVKVIGGTPDKKTIDMDYVIILPNGEKIYSNDSTAVYEDGIYNVEFPNGIYKNPRYGTSGTLEVIFYRTDNNNPMGSFSFNITD